MQSKYNWWSCDQIAKKYKGERDIESRLADKIIQGGGGVWGEQAMSAHPQIKKDEAKDIVKYIMSLGNEKGPDKKPVKGEYVTTAKQKEGSYIITASYTDKGNPVVGPQTSTTTVALRPATVKAVQNDEVKDATTVELPTKSEVLAPVKNGSYALYKDIDLTDISTLSFMVYATQTAPWAANSKSVWTVHRGHWLAKQKLAIAKWVLSILRFANSTTSFTIFILFLQPPKQYPKTKDCLP